jgi:hypothetical protein
MGIGRLDSLHVSEQAFMAVDFEYGTQILAALLPMAVTVIFHGLGISMVHRFFRRHGKPLVHGPHAAARTVVIIGIVAILLATHFVGVVVWAGFYSLMGMVPDVGSAMYFSIGNYTTLGSEGIKLNGRWQGFGGFEAMTAMLMFGWSTAVLASIVQKLQSTDD